MAIRKQVYISGILYIGQTIVGFGLGWTAPVIPKLQDPEQTPLPNVITDEEASWVASLLYIGTILGPYVSGWMSNAVGRKPCLYLGGVLSLFSFLLLAVSKNLAMIIAGRVSIGLGTGIIFVVNLVYIGEIASTKIRGILLTGTGIFSTFGTFLVYSTAPFVKYTTVNYIGMLLTLLYLTGLFVIPESPLFLIMKGREEKASEVLQIIGRDDEITNLNTIKTEMTQQKKRERDQWREIFSIKSNRKALMITLTLGILQQASGVVAVTFFATSIFALAGSTISAVLSTIIIGLTQIVSSSITPFFVEKYGRKSLLLVSTSACFLSLGTLGSYFLLQDLNNPIVDDIGWLPLVSLINFFIFYDAGFGIIPATFIGEMFTPNVRSTGSTLTITVSWLFGFAISTTFGYMLRLGTFVPFWFYTISCSIAFVFTILIVPETKGRSLMEIQEALGR